MSDKKYSWQENDEILKRLVSENEEELLSKKRAKELFDNKILETFEIGTFLGLQNIHKYLFQDIYGTAGQVRNHDISKDDTVFCKVIYLKDNLKTVSEMSENTFEEIIEKYVEMNMMHPFYEGNGRAMRIWLDQIFIKNLGVCVNWENIDKNSYLSAMRRSRINDLELRMLLKGNLTEDTGNRDVFMKGINQSYKYENMSKYDIRDLDK